MPRFIRIFRILLFVIPLTSCAFLIRTPAIPSPAKPPQADKLRGVFHIHTEYSRDSEITLDQLIRAGQKAELDFMVVTDHNTRKGEAVYQKGDFPQRPMLIFGEEITAQEGHLISLGVSEAPKTSKQAQTLLNWIRAQGGYGFLAHPLSGKSPWKNWDIQGYDGMEVYNFGHTFYEQNKFKLTFKFLLPPKGFMKAFHKTPADGLKLWTEQMKSGMKIAVGGADAHIHWRLLGFAPENLLLYLQSVTLYIWPDAFDEKAIVKAIGTGKSYLAYEALGDASRFSMKWDQTVLTVDVPVSAEIRIVRAGEILEVKESKQWKIPLKEVGIYWVEVYREKRLWILSNPIEIA